MMARVMVIAGAALLASGCAGQMRQQAPMRAAEVATNPPRAIAPVCGMPAAPAEICRGD